MPTMLLLPFSLSILLFLLPPHFPDLSTAQTTAAATTGRPENEYLKLQLVHISHSNSPSQTLLLDTRRVSSLHLRLKSPLVSGASVGSGQYFAGISIGTPPQNLLLVADTGSDLTWVKCSACRHDCSTHHPPGSAFLARHSCSFANVPCSDPHCRLVPHPPGPGCGADHSHTHSCKYEYSYADGSTTAGLFSLETATLNSSVGREIPIQELRFGCGFHVSGPSVTPGGFEGATGVMGLGRGPISFTSQLGRKVGNKFSYCLMDYTLSPPPTSYLVIGGGIHDVVWESDKVQSTPLIRSSVSPTYYYVGIKSVTIDSEKLPISSSVWALDDLGNGGTIIDTGTTLSFVPAAAYKAIVSAMRRRVKLPRVADLTRAGFDLCYNVSRADEDKLGLPRMSLELVGDTVFDPPARNYFIDTAEDVKCLALQAVNSPSGFAVIGNLMQQGFLFEFDNDRSRLFFSKGCHHRQ